MEVDLHLDARKKEVKNNHGNTTLEK